MSSKKQNQKIEAEATEQKQTATEVPQVPAIPTTFDNTGITPQTVMNFEYTKDETARVNLTKIVEALKSKTKVHVRTINSPKQHDLVVLQEGRQVIRVCPKRAGLSSSLPGDKGKISDHNPETILKAISKLEQTHNASIFFCFLINIRKKEYKYRGKT